MSRPLAAALVLIASAATVAGDPAVILYNGGPQHTGVYDTEPLRELTGLKWKMISDDFRCRSVRR